MEDGAVSIFGRVPGVSAAGKDGQVVFIAGAAGAAALAGGAIGSWLGR